MAQRKRGLSLRKTKKGLTEAEDRLKDLQGFFAVEYQGVLISELVSGLISSLRLENHKKGFRRYKETFLGKEAVQWIINKTKWNRETAVLFGELLFSKGVIFTSTQCHQFMNSEVPYGFDLAVRAYFQNMILTPELPPEDKETQSADFSPEQRRYATAPNPISSLPTQITQTSKFNTFPTALLTRQVNEITYDRVKVMIVGNSQVGKTSLQNFLAKVKPNEKLEDDKVGVRIREAVLDSIRFSIWDFTNQELNYTTPQFFLSNVAIYLVVFNLSKKKEINQLEFWLKSIRLRTKAAYIILVGTHEDLFVKN